jgi:hypothetical protein
VTIPASPKTQGRRVEITCGSGGSRTISASPAASEAGALDRFAEFSGKWEKRYPAVGEHLGRVRAVPAFRNLSRNGLSRWTDGG